MTIRFAAPAAVSILCLPFAALAQQEDPTFPNPLRTGNLSATCENWEAMRAANDPRAMQAVLGTWEGQGMIPGTPGIMPDTPFSFRATNSANGAFSVDQYACFQMQSVAGYPQTPPACAQSVVYGEWTAHFTPEGWIAVAALSSGSGYNGQALPMSCSINFFQLVDPNTLMDRNGNRQVRVN